MILAWLDHFDLDRRSICPFPMYYFALTLHSMWVYWQACSLKAYLYALVMPTAMDCSFEVDSVAEAYSLELDHLTYCSMDRDLVMGSD